MRRAAKIVAGAWISVVFAAAQNPDLKEKLAAIGAAAQGKISVACSLPRSSLNCDMNAMEKAPMQSVFKLPVALFALHLVEQGKLTLDQPIRFEPSDRILPHVYSPLQDKYPKAGVDLPLRELLQMAVSLSDSVAADIVLRITGGPRALDAYVRSLGIRGFHVQDDEAALHLKFAAQYRDWFQPASAVRLLRLLADDPPLARDHAGMVLEWMRDTPRGAARIKGLLPAGTVVMHKPGSSGTEKGLSPATNDIGLIRLPDGRLLAIAIFLTDSRADDAARDLAIAKIARAIYDAATPR